MPAALRAGAVLLLAPYLWAQSTQSTLAPSYSTASIANAATNLPSGFAPNSIITIYGSNLSFTTGNVTTSTNFLPISVEGITVYFGSIAGNIFYVSPGQVNVLVPYTLAPGPINVTLVRQGTAGPAVPIVLTATAPGLFQTGPNAILATHADSSLITAASPAVAGEVVIFYAVGLGRTNPSLTDGVIPSAAASVSNGVALEVLINGVAINPANIQYAGVTPGCAGLYQINVLMPTPLPPNPEIRVSIGPEISPAGMILPAQ